MSLKAEIYKNQQLLANYCRDGELVEIPGAKTERLYNYRRLVFNVVSDAIESAYPVTNKYIETKAWEEMVYEFFSVHSCQDPQVWRMPFEFYEFVVSKSYSEKYNIPYLNDLLYFEWLEIELYMMEDIPYPEFEESDRLLKNMIAVNPEYKLVKLEYPVHLLKPNEAKNRKGEYFLLLFREKDSGKIQFVNLSVLFAFLIENIIQTEKTLEEILNDILYVFGINDLEMLHNEVFNFLNDLGKKGFVLGIRKK